MADLKKDLRHMKRNELVEIIYQYQQNEKVLREELASLKQSLSDRSIKISEAGSVAEAALSLNEVFEAAQSAADQYLAEVQSIRANAENRSQIILTEAQKQADAVKMQAQSECAAIRKKTEEDCKAMRAEITEIIKSHDALRTLLNGIQ